MFTHYNQQSWDDPGHLLLVMTMSQKEAAQRAVIALVEEITYAQKRLNALKESLDSAQELVSKMDAAEKK